MKKHILIIEDESSVLNSMKRILKDPTDKYEIHTNTQFIPTHNSYQHTIHTNTQL